MGDIVPDAIERLSRESQPRRRCGASTSIARGNAPRGLPLVDAEVGALLRVLAHGDRRDAHPRNRHRDRLLGHLARRRAAAGRHAVHAGDERGAGAGSARELRARRPSPIASSVIVGDAQLKIAKVVRAVRSDFSGRRQEAVFAAARPPGRAAAARRPARHRQRAVGRRGRARIQRRIATQIADDTRAIADTTSGSPRIRS